MLCPSLSKINAQSTLLLWMKKSVRKIIHPTCKNAMARMKGPKPNGTKPWKANYDMLWIGVRVIGNLEYYEMKQQTVLNIIQWYQQSKQKMSRQRNVPLEGRDCCENIYRIIILIFNTVLLLYAMPLQSCIELKGPFDVPYLRWISIVIVQFKALSLQHESACRTNLAMKT